MSDYGITDKGLLQKSFTAIQGSIATRLNNAWGPVDTSPDGPLAQIIDGNSLECNEIWNTLSDVIAGFDPVGAKGRQLDIIGGHNGIDRLTATKTLVYGLLGGTTGTTIPIGSQAAKVGTNNKFSLTKSVTIDKNNAVSAYIQVIAGTTTTYEITLTPDGGSTHTISVVSSGTAEDVAILLQDELNANRGVLNILKVFVSTEDETKLRITSVDPFKSFAIETLNTGVVLDRIYTIGAFEADIAGATLVPPFTLTTIVTGVSGWDEVDNILSGQTGAPQEGDAAFRLRMERSFQLAGASTPLAMESKIWQFVPEVSLVRVWENPTSTIDRYGRLPHSVHCVVQGGDDLLLASTIAQYKAAGIDTNGKVSNAITDSAGNSTDVRFDRPGVIYGYIRITISSQNTEQVFPAYGVDQIRQDVYNYVQTNTQLGMDIVAEHFVGSIYKTPGFKSAKVEVAATTDPSNNPDNGPSGNFLDVTTGTYNSGWKSEYLEVAPWNRVEWRDSLPRIIVVNNL